MSATSIAAAMPKVGDIAPDFTLHDDTDTPRRLSDQRGQWLVLYFYPEDDTSGCTTEACEFRDAEAGYRELNATIWGVSKLGTGSKAAFKAKYGLPFTLLADEDHTVSRLYGTWVEKNNYGKKSMGIQRATFVIDPDGAIRFVWPRAKSEGHSDLVLAKLRELQGKVPTPSA
jgi:thioredoxin-dependent peroxiredoxin